MRAVQNAVRLGEVSRQYRSVHHKQAAAWAGCSRALWTLQVFGRHPSSPRSSLRQPSVLLALDEDDAHLWLSVASTVRDEDFAWGRPVAPTTPTPEVLARHRFDPEPDCFEADAAGHIAPTTQVAVQNVCALEARLCDDAVRCRAAAWSSDLLPHLEHANAGTREVRALLRGMLEASLHEATPGLWAEVQVFAAIWLSAFQCIRELIYALRDSETEASKENVFQQLSAHWDHVHNGVCGGWYWSACRPRPGDYMQRELPRHYARFARIWNIAEQMAGTDGGTPALAQRLSLLRIQGNDELDGLAV